MGWKEEWGDAGQGMQYFNQMGEIRSKDVFNEMKDTVDNNLLCI